MNFDSVTALVTMSTNSAALTHPWTVLTAQICLTAAIVGFTHPGSFLRRLALLPVSLVVPWYVLAARARVENTFQVSWGASQAVLSLYQYMDVALLNKWDFDFSGPQPREPSKKANVPYGTDNLWNRVKFGFYAASSFRNCGTPFETRGLQPFRMKDPGFVPSAKQYAISAIVHFSLCYLSLDALTSLGDPQAQAKLFAEHRIPLFSRLGEITFQEAVERTICSFTFWTVNYLVLSTFVTAISIITVATGLADVTWWKPLFNFGNGFPFTVRRFWSHFWHLSVKNRIYSPSIYVAEKWLKLPRGSLLSQYTIILLTFCFSMAFHALGDISCGIPPNKTGAPQFFLIQVVAIIFEDLMQYGYKRLYGAHASSGSSQRQPARWQKIVGRVWVFLFLFWCTPFYAYPVTAHNGDGMIVPFSIMRRVVNNVAA